MTAKASNPAESTTDREIAMSRDFDAPRELVWQAMTDSKHVSQWWGPDGFTDTIEELDFRVGGVWKHVMHGPDGGNYPNKSIFQEIVQYERVVFSHGGGREDKKVPGANFTATWTFEALDKKRTRLTMRLVFPDTAARDLVVKNFGAIEGGKQTLGKLAAYLGGKGNVEALASSQSDFVITRVFDAPRELVWEAWTDPRQMEQWWGPKDFSNPVCEMEVRAGGSFNLTMRSPDGTDIPLTGKFEEVVKPSRLVMSMHVPPHATELKEATNLTQTVTFEDLKGRTRLTVRSTLPSAQMRDHFLKMGMTEGWSLSLNRLADVTAKKSVALVVERIYDAPIARVWKALTDPNDIKQWYFDMENFKAEVGSQFKFVVEHEGHTYDHRCKITEIVPGKKIAYTWRYEGQPGESLVTFELSQEGNKTKVRLTHEGLETFPKLGAYARKNFLGGWTSIVGEDLKKFVEKT